VTTARSAAKARRCAETQAWLDAYKLERGCASCGYCQHPRALEFDHDDPSQKVAKISQMVWKGFSKKVILEEIAKCTLLCSNCHHVKTFEESDHLGKPKAAPTDMAEAA